MRPDTYTNYEVRQKDKEHDMFSRQKKAVKASNGEQAFIGIDLTAILQHLWKGLGKLYVAFKYQLSKRPGMEGAKFKIPWLKLGLAALALFVITQKDIHFSINMKAPLESMVDDRQESPNTPANIDQMSIVSPVSLTSKAVEPKFSLSTISDQQAHSYIKRFAKVARAEMDKFGIPASIKMAQGILESKAGTSEDAMTYNNHFGQIMSGNEFTSAWQNWRAHSLLLQENYPSLFKLGDNRKKWAKEFKRIAYSGDRNYGQYLLDIIDKYNLKDLD